MYLHVINWICNSLFVHAAEFGQLEGSTYVHSIWPYRSLLSMMGANLAFKSMWDIPEVLWIVHTLFHAFAGQWDLGNKNKLGSDDTEICGLANFLNWKMLYPNKKSLVCKKLSNINLNPGIETVLCNPWIVLASEPIKKVIGLVLHPSC